MTAVLDLHPIKRHAPVELPDQVRAIEIGGRVVAPTEVFDTYWKFAAERQSVYEARLRGETAPWTNDPVLSTHRFTNCYRAADRVSQYLIRHVIYSGSQEPDEVVFRVLLFKFFNRVSTWELLTAELGAPSWATFSEGQYDAVLTEWSALDRRLYSPAYVIPPPRFGAERKHTNHLRLLAHMMRTSVVEKLRGALSMEAAFHALKDYPGMGDFLAFQFLIDLNYSSVLNFDEMDYVVAGPGARDGIRKCFGADAKGLEQQIIRYMCDSQESHFARLGLEFRGLNGRRLQLIDCQNLFCEVDKYARVVHPEILGLSGRGRIKQKFRQDETPTSAWFPPKWGINEGLGAKGSAARRSSP